MNINSIKINNMNKTALITGASSGIGMELATVFAKQKENLILEIFCSEMVKIIERRGANKNKKEAKKD